MSCFFIATRLTKSKFIRRCGFDPWVKKIPRRRKWQLTPVFLPGKSQGQRSLAGYHSWGRKYSDMTEYTHTSPLPLHKDALGPGSGQGAENCGKAVHSKLIAGTVCAWQKSSLF